MPRRKLSYKDAGVDINANARWVHRLERAARSTYGPRVIHRSNAFAGLFRLDYEEQILRRNYRRPLMVGCADGVGTKVLLAVELGNLYSIGIDLVAMNVNDLVTTGAEPLFFLDYLAVNRLDPDRLIEVMDGIAAGCRDADCALLGGETAEMPELYAAGHMDMAGFAVGVIEQRRLIRPQRVAPGDLLIGLPSSGVHSNGFTLVRKAIREAGLRLGEERNELGGTLGAALIRPTRIYVRSVLRVLGAYRVKRVVSAMAHITGGGLLENVGRVIPDKCAAVIDPRTWTPPPIFDVLRKCGISRSEMFRVFNMGIGFVFVVRPAYANGVMHKLRRAGEEPVVIGRVKRGRGGAQFR